MMIKCYAAGFSSSRNQSSTTHLDGTQTPGASSLDNDFPPGPSFALRSGQTIRPAWTQALPSNAQRSPATPSIGIPPAAEPQHT